MLSHASRKRFSMIFAVFFGGILLGSIAVLLIDWRLQVLSIATRNSFYQNAALGLVGTYFSYKLATHKHARRPYAYSRE